MAINFHKYVGKHFIASDYDAGKLIPVEVTEVMRSMKEAFFVNTSNNVAVTLVNKDLELASMEVSNYVVSISTMDKLATGLQHLRWFANEIQKYAKVGILIAWNSEEYPMRDIIDAFCMKPRGDNFQEVPGTKYVVAYFQL